MAIKMSQQNWWNVDKVVFKEKRPSLINLLENKRNC